MWCLYCLILQLLFTVTVTELEVGNTIIIFERSLSIQLLNLLAELHFLELKKCRLYINSNLLSIFSHKKTQFCVLYKSFISFKFLIFKVNYKKFRTFTVVARYNIFFQRNICFLQLGLNCNQKLFFFCMKLYLCCQQLYQALFSFLS